jgi:hypothetical protein
MQVILWNCYLCLLLEFTITLSSLSRFSFYNRFFRLHPFRLVYLFDALLVSIYIRSVVSRFIE